MSGAASPTTTSSEDVPKDVPKDVSEDVYETPEALRSLLIPHRGEGPGAPVAPDPGAGAYHAAWLADQSPAIEAILAHADSDPDLVMQYSLAQADLAVCTPLAAAIGAAMALSPDTADYENPASIVDAWIAARGFAFAAAALLELYGVRASGKQWGSQRLAPWLCLPAGGDYYSIAYPARYFDLAVRMRLQLVAAKDSDYAQAREIVADYRKSLAAPASVGAIWARFASSFLITDQTGWLEDDFALLPQTIYAAPLALCAITTADQAAAFPAQQITGWHATSREEVLGSMLDTLGAGALPILATWLIRDTDEDSVKGLLGAIASLPSDEAFQFLLDTIDRKYFKAATLDAAKNFPRRAFRMLAEAALRDTPRGLAAANLLRLTLRRDDSYVADELPNLTPAAREYVEKVIAAGARLRDAAPDDLPALFVSPPWLTAVKPAKPVVITDLAAPTGTTMAWREGEAEDWASVQLRTHDDWPLDSWNAIAGRIREQGSSGWYMNGHFAVDAPEDLVRSVMSAWQPDSWEGQTWIPLLVTRFGPDALPPVLSLARSAPAAGGVFLGPFAAPEIALLAADWLSRLKTARPFAMAWLTRHPGVAARTLIPVALGKPGKARSAAEQTIRMLAAQGFADEIAEAAAGYGDAVAEAIAATVADDGTLQLPKVMPTIPDWAALQYLPQVLLKGREAALPEKSLEHLLLMLAVSKAGEPYAGIEIAKDICDPESLEEFAWALFENWRGVDFPFKEGWAFDALRWFGGETTVKRLSPMIRLWPGENGHSRAVTGLDVLTDIGGNVALMHLYGISQKVKFKALKERAAQRIADIADDLGLTAEQLGDRLVPDLGLDSAGTLVLDYGSRQFTVGFDEQLKPYVADQAGKRLKALPKPGAKDDPDLAPASYQLFSALKKEARALAASQIERLELAMVSQRRWSAEEFGEYFVAHPLLRHVVRRLVWATFTEDGIGSTFRVAEDLSLADVADNEYTLAGDASIGIAHPLELGRELAGWSEVFADYEILQPFEQLGRAVFALTDEERASTALKRFAGVDVPVGKILGLERRGWYRGVPEDGGVQNWIWRSLPGGGSVTVTVHPGMTVGYVAEWSEVQRFPEVFISRYAKGEGYGDNRQYQAFAGLDDIVVSEVLRDLTELTTA